jgi:hypothetical protein
LGVNKAIRGPRVLCSTVVADRDPFSTQFNNNYYYYCLQVESKGKTHNRRVFGLCPCTGIPNDYRVI